MILIQLIVIALSVYSTKWMLNHTPVLSISSAETTARSAMRFVANALRIEIATAMCLGMIGATFGLYLSPLFFLLQLICAVIYMLIVGAYA